MFHASQDASKLLYQGSFEHRWSKWLFAHMQDTHVAEFVRTSRIAKHWVGPTENTIVCETNFEYHWIMFAEKPLQSPNGVTKDNPWSWPWNRFLWGQLEVNAANGIRFLKHLFESRHGHQVGWDGCPPSRHLVKSRFGETEGSLIHGGCNTPRTYNLGISSVMSFRCSTLTGGVPWEGALSILSRWCRWKTIKCIFQKKSVKWASKGRTGVSLLYPLCDQFSPETERWHVNKSKSSSSGVSLSIANSKGSSEHVEGFWMIWSFTYTLDIYIYSNSSVYL